jgi:hypothetical protein
VKHQEGNVDNLVKLHPLAAKLYKEMEAAQAHFVPSVMANAAAGVRRAVDVTFLGGDLSLRTCALTLIAANAIADMIGEVEGGSPIIGAEDARVAAVCAVFREVFTNAAREWSVRKHIAGQMGAAREH